MKNLAKLQLETQRSKAKTKPMASARVARAVPQMRKAIKTITGRKDGGVIRPKPTFKGKVLKPKPIKKPSFVGMAIRGFGKAFKKGR
tara:strand:- start:332 stop:592 length:261 start_codon:yes stop_codon:yes gene_type:complete